MWLTLCIQLECFEDVQDGVNDVIEGKHVDIFSWGESLVDYIIHFSSNPTSKKSVLHI